MPVSKNYDSIIKNVINDKNAKLVIKSMVTGKTVTFPAFLTSFNQSFVSTWNEEDVYGRMDPIATFQNTRRSISLAFDLPASNQLAARDNLRDCDTLTKFLYPGYQKFTDGSSNAATRALATGGTKQDQVVLGRLIQAPPLVSVKFANLITAGGSNPGAPASGGQLGYLQGIEWTPVLEMGMFSDGENNLYPKVISLSFTLNVLHQDDKGWEGKNWIEGSNGFFGY
tara:strand:- start:333 stop:1010 length:678 start_codon:yes stop_codon:yes gene_type:complete